MASQSKRLEKALRGCAESGVPDTVDLWPAVRDRTAAQQAGLEQAGVGHDEVGARPGRGFPQIVPNTLLGWALAAVSVLILGVGIYAAAGPMDEFFRRGLPGTVEPGSDKEADRSPSTRPEANLAASRTEVDQTQIADGAKLTLDWAYADEGYVAVGLRTENLDGSDAVLQPSLWDDTVGNEAELPPYVKVTDSSGQDFDTVGGGTLLGPQRMRAGAVFDAPEGIEPGRKHRFRLEVPLIEEFGEGSSVEEPVAGPFVFDFEVPVRPAPTIRVDQEVEVEGVTLTLKRVVDSPVLPQAVVCFEPPDDDHNWMPWLKYDKSHEEGPGSAPQRLEDGCWSLMMAAPVEGRSSVTVTNLEGMPRGDSRRVNPKTIRGPWTFEFEVPER